MSSPLPCQGGADGHDACHVYPYHHEGRRGETCRSKREIDAHMRDVEWILEHKRCPELVARAEGWEVPCE
jgi:hypothetical protein